MCKVSLLPFHSASPLKKSPSKKSLASYFPTSHYNRAKRAAFPEINGFLWRPPKKIWEIQTSLLSWWDCTMMYEPILH